ncbi:glutamate ABC transporter substrate-binding protein [Streptomyces sp. SP18CS02]|uniref:glutamate ABC transporter substrate-binding protein n=1 Tax=Streptomyces sp. SP18CS02 TaxID=3002531 RepID=UPI002E764E8D|nr:glutamate ABC transporter substrate-binding protein [Streptomyces sp. SP18CS02]MEE1753671.1 glutamate ABC transporter substrate-binding protein [Streptomyces sp. SP18CS02]
MNRIGRTRDGRLRGWGGVAAMAAACGLTAALTLLPLSRGGTDAPLVTGAGSAAQAKAVACQEPEASLPPSAADGASVKAIKARGKLVVGIDQSSYRWGYRDPATGDLEGFDIELARAIAEDILGSPDAIIYRAIPTSQRTSALQNGSVDLVVRTMSITCKRIQEVAFSTAYFQVGQQVLAPRTSAITGYDASLAGKRVCSGKGTLAHEVLQKEAFGARITGTRESDGAQLYPTASQLDCLVLLQLGEVDAIVTDNALAAGQAAQDPGIELKGKPFTTEYYGVAAKLGNDDLVRRVNQVLVEYRRDAWMPAYEKWLKADLPGITGPPAPKYRTD